MDIALAVEKLLYAAEYVGSTTANTQEAWDAVEWQDGRRQKPTWAELQAAWADVAGDQREAAFKAAVQLRLDEFALAKDYNDIGSAVSYANSTNPQFAAEGQRAVLLRDETWAAALGMLPAVRSGALTVEAALGQLPALVWAD